VEENVRAARERGLRGVGIADHGPGHLFYGLRRRRMAELRAEIQRVQSLYPDIAVHMGVEANIINASGRLDVRPEEFQNFDFVLAGYHYGVVGENPLRALVLHSRNGLYERFRRIDRRLKMKNTALVEKALRNGNVKMLTHPGDKGPADILAIAAVCAETDTLFEINTWHNCVTEADLRTAAQTGVRFAISSDAHTPDRVGDCLPGVALALRAGLDLSRIVNLEIL
jgi:putative hydrolase